MRKSFNARIPLNQVRHSDELICCDIAKSEFCVLVKIPPRTTSKITSVRDFETKSTLYKIHQLCQKSSGAPFDSANRLERSKVLFLSICLLPEMLLPQVNIPVYANELFVNKRKNSPRCCLTLLSASRLIEKS